MGQIHLPSVCTLKKKKRPVSTGRENSRSGLKRVTIILWSFPVPWKNHVGDQGFQIPSWDCTFRVSAPPGALLAGIACAQADWDLASRVTGPDCDSEFFRKLLGLLPGFGYSLSRALSSVPAQGGTLPEENRLQPGSPSFQVHLRILSNWNSHNGAHDSRLYVVRPCHFRTYLQLPGPQFLDTK